VAIVAIARTYHAWSMTEQSAPRGKGLEAFNLEGRVAVVTGSRTGIGQAIAFGLAGAGAKVVLWGHGANLGETADVLRANGRLVRTVDADLADRERVEEACSELLQETRVDILVNNAGIIRRGPAIDSPTADWDAVMAVNLDSAFLLAQRFARPMLERGAGKIINVASVLASQGGMNVVAYAASKHGIAGLTRALANEWAPRGVQVNAIAPGYIQTKVTKTLYEDPARYKAILDRIPAGRWGSPDDLVGAAIFLSSAASDYVSGHVLAVDGGWLSR
jgi:2-deoxy-D-gluconate 3-dehydrogenase